MAKPTSLDVSPRTFFLNERQELSSFDREGGGRSSPLVGINWGERSSNLAESFQRAVAPRSRSRDPISGSHFFVVAVPVSGVEKFSKSKRAQEHGGKLTEAPTFGGEQSKLFRKMGMDLIESLPEGRASVHIPATRVEQLLATMRSLPSASGREKSRWINLEEFQELDWSTRIDRSWLQTLTPRKPVEAVIRFQPTLSRLEVQGVLQTLAKTLDDPNTRLSKAGREFSGRYWCSGLLTKEQLSAIAKEFSSVQSIHRPLLTHVAGKATRKGNRHNAAVGTVTGTVFPPLPPGQLPTVAVVDTGIPEQHPLLAPYRRSGYRNPDLDPTIGYMGDHASTVASCAVFGAVDVSSGVPGRLAGGCQVMDVMVSRDAARIDDDIIVTALETVVATAPDVRVFNLSLGGPPLDGFAAVERREELIKLQDLDNLAFARDILLVIAAGNSPVGVVPDRPYPNHLEDPRWALGTHARSFNGVVCGAYVDALGVDCVAGVIGAPSPFTRVGPGLCAAPVPGFSAPGGDGTEDYKQATSTGIWTCTSDGTWEDRVGTSVAAPLVSREAAWVFRELVKHCGGQTVPFAGTIKAWMSLVAVRASLKGSFERLALRTLGRGFPSAKRLLQPLDASAVFVWQAVLQAPKNVSRVQFPVPLSWLSKAGKPRLRVVAAWNSPVNAVLVDSWACRKVSIKIRPFGATEALLGGGTASGAYPLIDRDFDIHPSTLTGKGFSPTDALWILESEYDEIGEYPPAMTVSPLQRVGAVLELSDASEQAHSPQAYVQALPLAVGLDRLSVLNQPLQAPITIKH
jgi:hypothetical protein